MSKIANLAVGGATAFVLVSTLLHAQTRNTEDVHVVPPPSMDLPQPAGLETAGLKAAAPQTAVLSGGCFWGVQGVFEHVRGVQRVLAGYSGGKADTANYEAVSEGDTGHAESVQITYDPAQISYGRILQIFFSVALDPTMKDAQGPDTGTQYRSEIFTANAEQAKVARAYIAQLETSHTYHKPIVTRVDDFTGFYPAEAYHQDFLETHPSYPYIVFNDMPKVQALKTLFPDAYTPVATTSGIKS